MRCVDCEVSPMVETYVVVLVTVASKREAQRITKHLLGKRLIACSNILGPVESHFQWKGKLERAREFLVLMKSNLRLFNRLADTVKELHSYETPEILALPIVDGFQPYLDWMSASIVDSGET